MESRMSLCLERSFCERPVGMSPKVQAQGRRAVKEKKQYAEYPNKDKLTLRQVLHVKVPHAVKALLDMKGSYWFSNSRMTKYQAMMCENPRIHLDLIATLNPAILLPDCEEDPDHECLQVMEEVFSSRPDLKNVPLDKYDLQLFTDGSSYMNDGKKVSGYAVVSAEEIIKANSLPGHTSAQLAEITALTRALEISESKRVNIYTDSKYAFMTVHAHGALYKERGLFTSSGQQIKYAAEIAALLEAVRKPSAVSIMHCRGPRKVMMKSQEATGAQTRSQKRLQHHC
uniref:RNase H type-1 domain-containing protein n=1 Tax=Leptobrachium leishanense TaxID=445787 RepID=A0A8C5PF82_9ANUR